MNKKIVIVLALLALAVPIVIPESFAYPQYGGSCSNCHATNAARNGLGNEIGTAAGNNVVHTQVNIQAGDIPGQSMNPMKYTLGVIGTGLVVISQFYSLRKRRR